MFIIKNLLGLPELNITDVLEDTDGRSLRITAESDDRPFFCPACGSVMAPHKHSSKNRIVKDMHSFGKLVYIDLKVQRYRCKDCNAVFSETFNCIDDNNQMTTRMREDILNRCLKRYTFKEIADNYSISDKTVRRVFDEYVEKKRELLLYEAPFVIGIDEAHIDKHFRLVVTDIMNKQLLDMLPDNSYATVFNLLKNMTGKERIVVATMDFAPAYAKAVEDALPQVLCVIDKFHVVQLLNKKVDSIRISIHSQATKNGTPIKRLKREHKLFTSNLEDLSTEDCQTLSDWFKEYPQLEAVYMVKEQFREIYAKAQTRFEAEHMFDEWCKSIPPGIKKLQSLKRTFKQRRKHLLNYFDYRQTNAFTESINNYIKEIEKRGHGYDFEVLCARALFSTRATKEPKFEFKSAEFHQSEYYRIKIPSSPSFDGYDYVMTSGFSVDLEELIKSWND